MTRSAARAVRHAPDKQSSAQRAPQTSGSGAKRAPVQRAPSTMAMRAVSGPRVMLRSELSVNQPNDSFEREANHVADRVMRTPIVEEDRTEAVKAAQSASVQRLDLDDSIEEVKQAQTPIRIVQRASIDPRAAVVEEAQDPRGKILRFPCADCMHVMRKGERAPPAVTPATARAIRQPGAGQPLPRSVRNRIEPHVGADLGHVRVHQDAPAQRAADSLQARAFTHGSHIFLNRRESTQNVWLMAHEATHVVQQGAAPVQRAPFAREQHAVQRSADSDPPAIQRGILDSLASGAGAVWDATGGRLVDAAGEVIAMGADFFWSVIEEVAPSIVPIIRQIQSEGILGFLGGMIREAFGRLFVGLGGDPATLQTIYGVFDQLVGTVQTILAALASGDCGPLFEALGQLRDAVAQIAGDAWNAITDFFAPVGEFFSNLWQKFGAPLVDWISEVAGETWQRIQDFGAQIWAWTQPVRDTLAAAWNWVKEQIFGTETASGESEGGIVNWILGKAGEVWDAIKTELAPVIEPIQGFANQVMEFLPLGALGEMRDSAQGWLGDVQSLTANMQEESGVVDNQATLRDEVLPAILASIGRLQNGIASAGVWVARVIGDLSTTITGIIDSASQIAILQPLAGAIGFVRNAVTGLTAWAQGTVVNLFNNISESLGRLTRFAQLVLDTLIQVVSVISDLAGVLPNFIMGIWNRIPACLREPIENFIKENILGQIPIFAQLMQIPDIWGRITGMITRILRQVFVDGNLLGAAWTFFQNLLSFLGIPPELVVNIISKAAAAISDILGDPVGFFMNLLRAVQAGFSRFFDNILTHLVGGVTNWLFGEMQQAGVNPPADLSLRSIITFVLDVLGISIENVFRRMEEHPRIGPERTRRIRAVYRTITGALSWIVRLINEGPGAIWEEIQSQLSNLWNTALQAVIGWLNRTIIERAVVRLLSMLDPTGIMAVVNSIIALWNAIQSFVQYMRQILEVVNTVLDAIGGIARGVIDQAAGYLEQGMVRILPIAIGFLANQVGLGGVGRRIAEMIEDVRGMVNEAIDWLLNGAISMIDAVLGRSDEPAPAGAEPGAVSIPFDMNDHGHTLSARIDGNTVRVTMASDHPTDLRGAVQNAITTVQNMGDSAPAGLLTELTALSGALNDKTEEIRQEWTAQGARLPGSSATYSFDDYMRQRLTMITVMLHNIGETHNLTDLQNFFAQIPEQRGLPDGYDVRVKLYIRGSGWEGVRTSETSTQKTALRTQVIDIKTRGDQRAWGDLMNDDRIPRGSVLSSFDPDWIINGRISYDLDHTISLAEHWQSGGNNANSDEARHSQTVNRGNLRLILSSSNRRKGSEMSSNPEERARYLRWVGTNFRSQYAANNMENARTIDNQPFLHGVGGPPLRT